MFEGGNGNRRVAVACDHIRRDDALRRSRLYALPLPVDGRVPAYDGSRTLLGHTVRASEAPDDHVRDMCGRRSASVCRVVSVVGRRRAGYRQQRGRRWWLPAAAGGGKAGEHREHSRRRRIARK